jgi:hypothetical protein
VFDSRTRAPVMAANAGTSQLPEPLRFSGSSVANNWQRFRTEQWDNYLLAAELADTRSERQAAIFLTAIGTEAYDNISTVRICAGNRS